MSGWSRNCSFLIIEHISLILTVHGLVFSAIFGHFVGVDGEDDQSQEGGWFWRGTVAGRGA